jgi:putative Mg2+ transporter-C (MgtC) family protein
VTDAEIFLRLLLAFTCGTIVGLERQWHHKNAGLKTNTLVAVGATTFTIVAELGFGTTYLPQVAAGVVTGIGFIGGGVIMKRGASVQGINSAATLWATASIGLAIGRGYNVLALLVLAFVAVIQFVEHGLANWIDQKSNLLAPEINYTLDIRFLPNVADSVRRTWQEFSDKAGVHVIRYSETRTGDSGARLETVFQLSELRRRDLNRIIQNLTTLDGVSRAEWSHSRSLDDNLQ